MRNVYNCDGRCTGSLWGWMGNDRLRGAMVCMTVRGSLLASHADSDFDVEGELLALLMRFIKMERQFFNSCNLISESSTGSVQGVC